MIHEPWEIHIPTILKRQKLMDKVGVGPSKAPRCRRDFQVFIEDNCPNLLAREQEIWDRLEMDYWHRWLDKKNRWIGIADWRAYLRKLDRQPERIEDHGPPGISPVEPQAVGSKQRWIVDVQ